LDKQQAPTDKNDMFVARWHQEIDWLQIFIAERRKTK